jgi:hypothetical protein
MAHPAPRTWLLRQFVVDITVIVPIEIMLQTI